MGLSAFNRARRLEAARKAEQAQVIQAEQEAEPAAEEKPKRKTRGDSDA